jgi:cellulase
VDFFKIYELGYDKSQKKWANEIIIGDGYKNTIQLPSDIKPGTYILRTDLLSLHGNGKIDGPQFYTHCFNLEISGSGTATPAGVKFPGGYGANEPGVVMRLSGGEAAFESYVSIPFSLKIFFLLMYLFPGRSRPSQIPREI